MQSTLNSPPLPSFMDLLSSAGDASFRHIVVFNALPVRFAFDCNSETVEVVKEIRNCVIAVAAAWLAVSLVKSALGSLDRRERR